MYPSDTITAISTASGTGAVAMIRLSGPQAIPIAESVFFHMPPSRSPEDTPQPEESEAEQKTPLRPYVLSDKKAYTLHHGMLCHQGEWIDEVMIALFRAPHSYTGEDTVEITCHGAPLLQQQIIRILIAQGARMAGPGEFSMRAFLNGKMDLTQAEGIADLIASQSDVSRRIALGQMRGGFSAELHRLRSRLLYFVSLVELELDFSEEDVEFADRRELKQLIREMDGTLNQLIRSFAYGNVIKNGVPTVIAGGTNVGKSTLLNTLLNEERAIVSDIHGTTRDVIEDTVVLDGIRFRFIDTAGIRPTSDTIETMGIERTYEQLRKARIILLMVDAAEPASSWQRQIEGIRTHCVDAKATPKDKQPAEKESVPFTEDSISANKTEIILVLNKCDQTDQPTIEEKIKTLHMHLASVPCILQISAKYRQGIAELKQALGQALQDEGQINEHQVVVTNLRHYEALQAAAQALHRTEEGLDRDLPGDLLSQDIRDVLYHLGTITGEITNDEVLGEIFGKFCIGK